MKTLLTSFLFLALVAVVFVLYQQNASLTTPAETRSVEVPASPVDVDPVAETDVADEVVEPVAVQADSAPAEVVTDQSVVEADSNQEQTDVTAIAHERMSDGDFNNLVANLDSDPAMLPLLLEEFRNNSDPDRARRIAQLMENRQDSRITELGEQMVYSGDPESQKAGLALLGTQQGSDSRALDVVVDIIDLEENPDVLTSALNALAKPGRAEPEQKERVVDQFKSRVTHGDPIVRRHSLTLLSRWSGESDMNDVYLTGLEDQDERVRTGALFALKSSKHPSEQTRQAFIRVIQDVNENRLLRLNALSGLKKYDVPAEEIANYRKLIRNSPQ